MSDSNLRGSKGVAPFPPPRTYAHAVSRWFILPFLNTWVRPNHVTTLRLATGVCAAAAFSVGTYFWACMAGFIFVFSSILDRADGELARLGGYSSRWGHWYDLSSDMVVNMLVFTGIGIGMADRMPKPWAPVLGLVAGASVVAIFIVVLLLHGEGSHPSAAFRYPNGFDFDDTLFVIAIFAWMDGLLPLLIASAVGTPLFFGYAVWSLLRVRSKART